MSALSSLAKHLLPPVATRLLQRLSTRGIRFEGDFATWHEATSRCAGYDASHILTKVLQATLKIKRGEAAFERDSVLFDKVEYAWPIVAALMFAAARNGGNLDVLDFGGALGSHYFQNRKFLSLLSEVHWSVIEQEHFATAGIEHIQDQTLRFYSTIDSCLEFHKPNAILLSGVLQYLEDPHSVLDKILRLGADCLMLDRTPYLRCGSSETIKIQITPSSIYHASYPCRFFVEGEIVDKMRRGGYCLLESFESLDRLDNSATWKGHIFHKERPDG